MTLALFCMRYFRTILNVALMLRTWELKWGPISESVRLQDLELVLPQGMKRNDKWGGWFSTFVYKLFEQERPFQCCPRQPLLGKNGTTDPSANPSRTQGSWFSCQCCLQSTQPVDGIRRAVRLRRQYIINCFSFKVGCFSLIIKAIYAFLRNLHTVLHSGFLWKIYTLLKTPRYYL